jgi:predicted phosphodiesterase
VKLEREMRIAIISDIHGNLTAFEAVLADLRETAPDLIVHGGDLAASGSSPCEIVDRVRALGWPGVMGNADEMLFTPQSLSTFAARSPGFRPFFKPVDEMAAATRALLGEERLAWLGDMPLVQVLEGAALVHASPGDVWRAPAAEAVDRELESTYPSLGRPVAVYAHIHCPFVRRMTQLTVANTGSVSLSYDGDRRASYLLIEEGEITIRRVDYDVAREVQLLHASGMPHADWVVRTLESGTFQLP